VALHFTNQSPRSSANEKGRGLSLIATRALYQPKLQFLSFLGVAMGKVSLNQVFTILIVPRLRPI